jgi:hypothetical protein
MAVAVDAAVARAVAMAAARPTLAQKPPFDISAAASSIMFG